MAIAHDVAAPSERRRWDSTGPGIAAEDIKTIFEKLEQARDGKQAEGTA